MECQQLLGHGRKDESGDFTKGADLIRRKSNDYQAYFQYLVIIEAEHRWTVISTADSLIECENTHVISEQASRSNSELDEIANLISELPVTAQIEFESTPPSSAASNTTPARFSKLNC